MTKPTLHITNFSARTLHRGHVYSIMTLPKWYHEGEGRIAALIPNTGDLLDLQAGRISVAQYRASYAHELQRTERTHLQPGRMQAVQPGTFRPLGLVQDGDTLCCACSMQAAAASKCHRVWAAEFLHATGLWRVVLDGRELGVPVGEQLALL